MIYLETLKQKALAATQDTFSWQERIQHEPPIGYDLERVFAIGPIHSDNPRKNHDDLARADSKFIAAANPKVVLELIEEIEHLRHEFKILQPGAERHRMKLKMATETLELIAENDRDFIKEFGHPF